MRIEAELGQVLIECGLRLAVAETTTGGLICARIVTVPGSSKYFDCGVVAYSRHSKTHVLDLSEELLDEHGAVSEETAIAMAQGVRRISHADVGLAETGIAGPVKGRSPKPVGTCFIAVAIGDDPRCEERIFPGDRHTIRNAIATRAMELVIERVRKEPMRKGRAGRKES